MKKILVADEEEGIRMLYREELEEEGYEVKVVANGKEALELLNSFIPDLVILDIKMPDISGIEVLQQIGVKFRNLPVILSSAYPEYQQDLATWASDAYIVKSSNLESLKATIKKILAK
ncbi:MAG: response regulator [Desulfobacterota bacterium]|nr:response regulator [Thermodesulfobacteriota bacterium]